VCRWLRVGWGKCCGRWAGGGKKALHAAERDSAVNRQRRPEFLARIAAIAPEQLIFLDESGVTTQMTR
jgi:hypothetical protein